MNHEKNLKHHPLTSFPSFFEDLRSCIHFLLVKEAFLIVCSICSIHSLPLEQKSKNRMSTTVVQWLCYNTITINEIQCRQESKPQIFGSTGRADKRENRGDDAARRKPQNEIENSQGEKR